MKNKGVVIYQLETALLDFVATIFNIDRTVATKHIGNILKIKEIDEKSNVQKMHILPVIFFKAEKVYECSWL